MNIQIKFINCHSKKYIGEFILCGVIIVTDELIEELEICIGLLGFGIVITIGKIY